MLHFVSFLANKKQKIAPNKYKHRFTMLRPTSIIDKQQEDIFTKFLGPALGNTETAGGRFVNVGIQYGFSHLKCTVAYFPILLD